jgi:hypothetical protein
LDSRPDYGFSGLKAAAPFNPVASGFPFAPSSLPIAALYLQPSQILDSHPKKSWTRKIGQKKSDKKSRTGKMGRENSKKPSRMGKIKKGRRAR